MWMFLPGLIIEFIGIIFLIVGFAMNSLLGIIVGVCLIVSAIVVHILQIMKMNRSPEEAVPDKSVPSIQLESYDNSVILYSDSLVTITGNAITFKNYSFPFRKPRQVHFSDIDHIDVLEPLLATGKYKMWGGNLYSIWFPLDSSRSSRDKIFRAYLKIRGLNIGFTVENSSIVTIILRSKGLIKSEDGVK